MLALYLGLWLVVLSACSPNVALPEIERGLDRLWSGGSLGDATSIGGDNRDVTNLCSLLAMKLDISAPAACVAAVVKPADRGIHRRVLGSYPIFYRVAGERIDVSHILHGARDCEAILFPED